MKRELYDLIYKHNQEADDFIKKHVKEFPVESYNDVTDINPSIIRVKSVSLLVSNIHLLKSEKARKVMSDYYHENLSNQQIMDKYKYASLDVVKNRIKDWNKIIKKRFLKNLDIQFALETRKVSQKILNDETIKTISFGSSGKTYILKLVKVPYKNQLNYKFYDEDVAMLITKLEVIKPYISVTERMHLAKYNKTQLQEMGPKKFKRIREICVRYRWVNDEGYLLPKVLDDAITNILLFNSSEKAKGLQ